ncbi:hypothetical protein [Paracoccus marcusii]|uniref:Uncharacterized protein n=1 Tax=Paracoccus marcusii TaxID=59779 RepID=A0ABY7UQ26_9RHOB|nr:hypothetical protein [Paracoccus marcusii]WDA11782.1 hypothetical protein PRL19_10790 [Paracoccus marcusii]
MSPQDIEEHRKRIGFEVSVLLKTDYFAPDLSPEELAASIANWCDALEQWNIDQIRAAFNEHRDTRPDKRPNPGHIREILKRKRGQEFARRRRQNAEVNRTVEKPRAMTPERHAVLSQELAAEFPSYAHMIKRMPKAAE